jgi:hypothetical protein
MEPQDRESQGKHNLETRIPVSKIVAAPLVDDAIIIREMKAIMQRHHGDLTVNSTTATYTFPDGTYKTVSFPWSRFSAYTIHFPDGVQADEYVLPSGEASIVFAGNEFSEQFQQHMMKRVNLDRQQ